MPAAAIPSAQAAAHAVAPAARGTDENAHATIDAHWADLARSSQRRPRRRPTRDRGGSLLLLGLLAAAAVVLWLRMLAAEPHLPLSFRSAPDGGILLDASQTPSLQAWVGRRFVAITAPRGQRIEAGRAWLSATSRWIVDDTERAEHLALRAQLAAMIQQPTLTLWFEPGIAVSVKPVARGYGGLGALCWLLSALALVLGLAAAVVILSSSRLPARLYGLTALAQALNLLLICAEVLPGVGLPRWLAQVDLGLPLLAEATLMASLVHVTLVYPRQLRAAPWLALLAWGLALLAAAWAWWLPSPGLWWWARGLVLGYGLAAACALHWSRRSRGGPLAGLLLWLVMAGTGTLLLLSVAVAVASRDGASPHALSTTGSVMWHLFLASLLLLAPFLSRSRQVLRELAVLAGVSTVAASLHLLFEAVLALGPVASLLLALALSLTLYAVARPWILSQLAGSAALSAERMFDSLYRVARELEQTPEQAPRHISALLREVFDPLELSRSAQTIAGVWVAQDGSTLVAPVPLLGAATDGHHAESQAGSIVLRFARRGRRLFTHEDLHLTERLIEQLKRAVAYDRAVEQGRTEERARIAQDLHDDIGARLLTLMYKAANPEIEEYIRHTLQDLKTLTRGLAAANHRLSHAAAEWKSDITQRLAVTGCDLRWSFTADSDILLTVVQWSGLTRVLRELVNNIISHAHANQVDIHVQFDRGQLAITLADDGLGRQPDAWSHGLGLGGVRKRVKLLGGQVKWVERSPRGIRCEVRAALVVDKR